MVWGMMSDLGKEMVSYGVWQGMVSEKGAA